MNNRKKTNSRAVTAVAIALCASTVLAACGNATGSENEEGSLTWKAAWYVGEGQSTYDVGAEGFKQKVEEASHGSIAVDIYPSEQLGKAADSLNMVKNGIADEAFTAAAYHLDQIPLSAAWNMPLRLEHERIVEARWAAAHEEGPFVEEMREAGLVPLFLSASPNYEISTTDTPLESLEDLRGLQIRVSSETDKQIMDSAGATGITGASSELYEMLERGVVDGTVFHYGSFDSSGIDTLMENGTSNLSLPGPIVGSFTTQERWDELTEEQQQVIYEAARAASAEASDAIRQEVEDELPGLVEAGLEISEWPEEDVDEFYAGLEPIVADWEAQHEGGEAAIEQVRELTKDLQTDGTTDLDGDFASFQF